MKYDCLIIDDEEILAESTAEYFNTFNVSTTYVTSAKDGIDFFNENSANLILLDINLNNDSGFELCKELRKTQQIPILFISARSAETDQIIALNIGGDDYIPKPYSLGVLLAKVKVVLKRYNSTFTDTGKNYIYGNLKIDYHTDRVYINQREISLKGLEYKLLCYLIKNKNRIITKEELFDKVWEDVITGDGTLNVHIRHLREKVEANPNNPILIKTIWGRGYLFEEKTYED